MIGLLGLDYRWTSTDVRGRLTFTGDRLLAALRALADDATIDEAVVISTCNRTEVYVATSQWLAAAERVKCFLSEAFARGAAALITSVPTTTRAAAASLAASSSLAESALAPVAAVPAELADALYEYEGVDAARHLLRVAAGLQSMVVGEAQILGQVKESLAAAEVAHTAGDELRSLFNVAIKVGKRARAETEIGRADVSVASLAVRVASQSLGGLVGKSALLIGAGRTSQLCAQQLRSEGIERLILANRSPQTATSLAGEVNGEVIALADVAEAIARVQLVISATAAPYEVLSAATVACGMAGRHLPLVIVDLAVPPDVEEAAGLLPDVSLYTLDMLQGMESTEMSLLVSRREAELAHAEAIVEDGVLEFVRTRTMRLAVPGIAALRRHVDRSEQAELIHALGQLEHLTPEDRAVIERFGGRLVDKMFHHLVSRIRSLAEYDEVPPEVTMQVLTRLFADPDTQEGGESS